MSLYDYNINNDFNSDTESFIHKNEIAEEGGNGPRTDKYFKEKIKKPFPKLQVFLALLCVLPEAFADSLIIPYIYNMVKDFGIAEKEEDIGFYVGLLGSIFYFSLCITNIFWGHMSDRFGRKPILLCNLIGTSIGTVIFGYSTNFAMAMLGRFVAGSCSANGTVAKGIIGEVIDESQRSLGYSFYGVTWGIASMIGPLIGGYLVNPSEKYFIFEYEFWETYKYLLPSLFVMTLGVTIFFLAIKYLKEPKDDKGNNEQYQMLEDDYVELTFDEPSSTSNNSNHDNNNNNNSKGIVRSPSHNYQSSTTPRKVSNNFGNYSPTVESVDDMSGETAIPLHQLHSHNQNTMGMHHEIETNTLSIQQSLHNIQMIFTKSTWIAIGCYCLLSLATMLFFTVFPLWEATSVKLGGLGFDEKQIAVSAPILGISKIIIQLVVYPPIAKHMSSIQGYRFGLIVLILFSFFTPFIPKFVSQPGTLWTLLIIFLSLFSTSDAFAYLSVIIMITESVTNEHLGFMHGFSGMCVSIMRMIGPTLAGSVWSWSINNGLGYPLNEHMIFFIILGLCVSGFALSLLGFKKRN